MKGDHDSPLPAWYGLTRMKIVMMLGSADMDMDHAWDASARVLLAC